ncbi:hypothetical protein LRP67_12070 [Nocardioides sp. cx-169]|uniref:hypothetical protein n=1 Tax=Nocardioides sp. cx-169 TaxID=2899080 RepID=UPI001E54E8B7|nr:hypothetical protein [Nocardioides sp. cx-169]MCD4534821.1 hypothetical protein [Nocardioides sp. cx-169]
MRPTPAARRDPLAPSVREAREVVGMYGDPDTTWGLCLEVRLTRPEDAGTVAERVAKLCARRPHLGIAPVITRHRDSTWADARRDVAAAPYGPTSPLLRLALTDDGMGMLIGAHHGVVDGLGLLAVAGAALGRELRSSARGIGERAAPHGFVGSSVRRLGEALVAPPARFVGSGGEGPEPEDLSVVTRPRVGRGTADLAAAVLALHADLPTASRRRPVLVIGASRRPRGVPQPDRQTAYLRLRMRPGREGADRTTLARTIADLRPEPDFPETSAGGAAPLVVRLLKNRLGATAMLSNLGGVEGEGLASVAMYPALSGPRSVAVGLVSTGSATTLTLRTRREEFDVEEHARLMAGLADRFFG